MKTEIEEQITAKRIPGLVALVAKLETQAFGLELDAAELRRKADAARAELRRLTGEAEPAAPAPLTPPPPPRPPLDVPDELTTCPDPDIHLPRPGRPSGPLVEAGRRGYASGQEEALAWVAEQLQLEAEGTLDEVRTAIEVRLYDLQQPRPAAGIADHVVPPAPAAPPRAPEPLETIAERCGVLGVSPEASVEAINEAFKAAALRVHPDRGGTSADMAQLTAARDEGRRARGR